MRVQGFGHNLHNNTGNLKTKCTHLIFSNQDIYQIMQCRGKLFIIDTAIVWNIKMKRGVKEENVYSKKYLYYMLYFR